MRLCRAAWLVMMLATQSGSAAAQEAVVPQWSAAQIVRAAGIRGGLCVHLNVTDGKLTADLAKEGKFVVHGVATTPEATAGARRYVASCNLHGVVSVEHGALSRLPYVDNLVNLIVVDNLKDALGKGLSLQEVVRVLCPGGVACLGQRAGLTEEQLKARLAEVAVKDYEIIRDGGLWVKFRKPRPPEMDEWTHRDHGPECNLLSSDSIVVDHGARLQWLDGPIWLAGINAAEFFAGGRAFNVIQHNASKPQWVRIVARDAFNGLVLWEREFATGGESYNPRVVVAVGERVFAVVKKDGPLAALDAASGNVVKTYDVGISPRCVLYQDGYLVIAADKAIFSVNAETGKARWMIELPGDSAFRFQNSAGGIFANTDNLSPNLPRMMLGNGRLFISIKDAQGPPYSLVCYDLATGAEKWRERHPGEILKCYQGVVAMRDQPLPFSWKNASVRAVFRGISTDDGRQLWEYRNVLPVHGDADIYCSGEMFWVNVDGKGLVGFDTATGVEKLVKKTAMSAQCGGVKTTECYFIRGFAAFFNWRTGKSFDLGGYKNSCGVGQIPANGLIYNFPISCPCRAYVRGFQSFAPAYAAKADEASDKTASRLEKGPAYGFKPLPEAKADSQWATYRRDNRRSGSTPEALGSSLRLIWSETVTDQERALHGKTLAPPVVAQGMVFVAAPDAHHVSALDAETGRLRWRFLLGGRVEAPPTIFKGLCLLGANDGWVYCLRAADGELLWRFRAAPREQRIMAYGRLESPWPVPGVLVEGDIAYFAAGRHGRGDEGIYLYAVDPFTGKVLWEKCWRNIDFWDSGFMVNDVLVSNGKSIFMSLWMYDPRTGEKNGKWQDEPHLRSGTGNQKVAVMSQGFLYDRKDGVWLERYNATYWYYRGASALLLAFTDDRIFGITTDGKMRPDFELFAKRCGDAADPGTDAPLWSTRVPAGTQALLPAGSTLFVAGPGDKADPKGGMLWSYSVADGSKLSELRFGDAPIFDGMAAANGRLYISTGGGKVFCFGQEK